MKFISLIVLFSFFILTNRTYGQQQKSVFHNNSNCVTSISGILAPDDTGKSITVVLFLFDYSQHWLLDFIHQSDTVITNTGYFHFKFFIDHPMGIILEINGIRWFYKYYPLPSGLGWIEPKDDITIRFTKRLSNHPYESRISDVAHFFGKGSEKYKCMQLIDKRSESIKPPSYFHESIKLMAYSDSIQSIGWRAIDEFRYKLTEQMCFILKAELQSTLDSYVFRYILENPTVDSTAKLAYERNIVKKPFIINNSVKYAPGYAQFLIRKTLLRYNYLRKAIYQSSNKNPYGITDEICYKIISRSFHTPFRQWLLSYMLIGAKNISQSQLNLIRIYLLNEDKNDVYYKQVKKAYDEWNNDLSPGKTAFKFSLPDTNGVIRSMSDFKGKVTLLDFMFFGCGGCAHLVPYLTELEEKFKDTKEVAFVSISIDCDTNFIKKSRGMFCPRDSYLLFTKCEKANHQIIKFYKIQEYPTLVLIDKEGRIISSRAPDPRKDNGKGLINLINDALNR